MYVIRRAAPQDVVVLAQPARLRLRALFNLHRSVLRYARAAARGVVHTKTALAEKLGIVICLDSTSLAAFYIIYVYKRVCQVYFPFYKMEMQRPRGGGGILQILCK